MAGEWIKMRTSLLTNPKVNGIARILESSPAVGRALSTGFNGSLREIVTRNVTRHVTVSALLIIWGAANEHTRDGVFRNADLSDIDDMVSIPGFGEAMVEVGWAEFDSVNYEVSLPNFVEYNTTGDERSAGAKTAAQRQKEYRDRKKTENVTHSDVTNDVTRNRREEKRREEVKASPIPPAGGEVVPVKKSRAAIELKTYLSECKTAGVKPIPEGDPVFAYADKVALPAEFLHLQWREFRERYCLPGAKRYKSWPTVFRKSVQGNWFKLWFVGQDDQYALTTVGQQAKRNHKDAA